MDRKREQGELRLDWRGGLSGYSDQLSDSRMLEAVADDLFGVCVIWELMALGYGDSSEWVKVRVSEHGDDEEIRGFGAEMRIVMVLWAELC